MKHLIIPIALLLLCAACGGEEEVGTCGDPIEQISAHPEHDPMCYLDTGDCDDRVFIDYVYDGDTPFLPDGSSLRMYGLQAPEMEKGTEDPYLDPETCFSEEAREYLSSLIAGREVCVKYGPNGMETDGYGRPLVYIFSDGMNINNLMVASGHGCAYDDYPAPGCDKAFLVAEASAISKKLGIWGVCSELHGDPCKRAD